MPFLTTQAGVHAALWFVTGQGASAGAGGGFASSSARRELEEGVGERREPSCSRLSWGIDFSRKGEIQKGFDRPDCGSLPALLFARAVMSGFAAPGACSRYIALCLAGLR